MVHISEHLTHQAPQILRSGTISRAMHATALVIGGLLPNTALAGHIESPTAEYPISIPKNLKTIDVGDETQKCGNRFGGENITKLEDGSLQVLYPASSSTPGEIKRGKPLGGMGAICNLGIDQNTKAFNLSYTINIPENFILGKGLKLHGLCFDDCPRGGRGDNNGVSLRLHTRKSAGNTFSAYIHSDDREEPVHHADQDIVIEPGGQYDISMNINQEEGTIQVYINNQLLYSESREDFERLGEEGSWKLMLSTFRGGKPSWAIKEDTSIEFGDFSLEITE